MCGASAVIVLLGVLVVILALQEFIFIDKERSLHESFDVKESQTPLVSYIEDEGKWKYSLWVKENEKEVQKLIDEKDMVIIEMKDESEEPYLEVFLNKTIRIGRNIETYDYELYLSKDDVETLKKAKNEEAQN